MSASPPAIFSPARRKAMLRRAAHLQRQPDPARFLAEDAAEDILDRLSFLRHEPKRCWIGGDHSGLLAPALTASGAAVTVAEPSAFEPEQPWPVEGFDLIACLFLLDQANDLPGSLIHLRRALAPGGLAIITMVGAGSLPALREAMRAADGERPAPRLHPQVDVRAGGQLMQRAGYSSPVVDSRSLIVRYGSLDRLVGDLRAQGLSNVLSDPGPPLSRAALEAARAAFASRADADGKVSERFELLTLSGWRSA